MRCRTLVGVGRFVGVGPGGMISLDFAAKEKGGEDGAKGILGRFNKSARVVLIHLLCMCFNSFSLGER
jgi:hypothetical protein